MNILSGELPATLTYTSRDWSWIGRTDPADVADGTLTVNFTRGKTGRAKVESRRYSVQECPFNMGRQFLFLKSDGQPDQAESDIYAVSVLPHGVVSCTCKAASCKAPCCIHADVIPALIEAGAFDPPEVGANPDSDTGPTEIDDQELPECFRNIGWVDHATGVPF